MLFQNSNVVSVELKEGKLHVIYREPSNEILLTYPARPAPDRVWKEIYGVDNGEIVLESTLEGTHKPAQNIPESIEFPTQQNNP